jgi:hypothetical protein
MAQTQAVIQYANMKLRQICADSKDQPIPNWWSIEDMKGFGIRISEGDLNFLISVAVYPVEEAGPGHFLTKLQATFLTPAVQRQGYEFVPMPIGPSVEMDYPVYAEDEQELQNSILQWISDDAENILCRILE